MGKTRDSSQFHKKNSFKGFKKNKDRKERNFNRSKQDFNKSKPTSNKINNRPENQLTEKDVGITEYISQLEGFSGVIKARFSDFQVNEIDLNGQVAKLTNKIIPDLNSNKKVDKESNSNPVRIEQIPLEIWENVLSMLNGDDKCEAVSLDVTNIGKEDRTAIHKCIKAAFGRKIISSTVVKDDKKLIEFKKYNKNIRIDNRKQWPSDVGEYVHFVVFKQDMDTLEANFKISDCINMRPGSLTYAGVKDRRAKTTQWFSVRKVEPWKLIVKTKYLRNIHIGNIAFKNAPLKLGQLQGNRFRIALRNITVDEKLINESMESLKENGFINYYGLQRFGRNKNVPTHEIGVKLMQGNWKEACDLILKPTSWDDPDLDITKAKNVFSSTADSKLASEEFTKNKNKCVESKLLAGLIKNGPCDYVNALEFIPRNMRLLYIHAFQSLVWNQIVSKRIAKFGLKPILGDLIVTDQTLECTELAEDESEPENVPKIVNVKILSEADLENYSIYDIVLPLPGYDIIYPENEVKTWYQEILESYGLSLEMPKQKVKTYTLSGAYRKILGRLENLSWKTMRYNNHEDNLIRSDFEELIGEAEPEDTIDGCYKALIIDFCLKSSSYATMALREVLKVDTSSATHSSLNNYQKKIEVVESPAPTSLLLDVDNYEVFKKSVMEDVKNGKRECEAVDMQISKKVKLNESGASCSTTIKLEPALP